MSIHPTAIVHDTADIDPSNDIGPFVVIERDTVLGPNNKILNGAYVGPGTRIGRDNIIHMHTVIGHEPQDFSYSHNHDQQPTYTHIGDGNVFREGVTVHRGTAPDTSTRIGSGCMFMANSHIAHNCTVGNRVIMANGALIGGHVSIDNHAFLSGNVVVHQFCRIGTHAMIGGLSGLNQDAPPFLLTRGTPGRVFTLNVVGLRRAHMTPQTRRALGLSVQHMFHGSALPQAVAPEYVDHEVPEVAHLARFILESKRGVCQSGRRR